MIYGGQYNCLLIYSNRLLKQSKTVALVKGWLGGSKGPLYFQELGDGGMLVFLLFLYTVIPFFVYPPLFLIISHPLFCPFLLSRSRIASDWCSGGRMFGPGRVQQLSLVEIDPEIVSTIVLSHSLIEDGLLSVSGDRKSTSIG